MSDLVEVKTIGEVERIVHASGMWDGTGPVEFSNDGTTWAETWAPTEGHPLPEFARVEVYRKDVRIPTRATIRWDEQIPQADPFWTAKWVGAPMRHFGRTVRMVAFRQTFRDLLGDIAIEDEDRAHQEPAPDVPRDYAAKFAAADTVEALDKIVAAARAERVFTPTPKGTALDRAWKARRRELTAAAWEPKPGEQRTSTGARRATERKPGMPQDFLAPNRAARRAQAKGRRK
ncbi:MULTISPECIES: hypothetical protein [unclassified Microbacterium]|uniref:hypothetical protein n=1 Tax=unclassified Microbacterium TaxID=2609290 RepID=UPI00364A7D64